MRHPRQLRCLSCDWLRKTAITSSFFFVRLFLLSVCFILACPKRISPRPPALSCNLSRATAQAFWRVFGSNLSTPYLLYPVPRTALATSSGLQHAVSSFCTGDFLAFSGSVPEFLKTRNETLFHSSSSLSPSPPNRHTKKPPRPSTALWIFTKAAPWTIHPISATTSLLPPRHHQSSSSPANTFSPAGNNR